MTRVKVCGITRETDLRAAVDAGADAVGLISDVPVDTPRDIDPSVAADLAAAAPPFVSTTLVLMPDSPEHAVGLAQVVKPDVVQLHGVFDPEELQYVRAESGCKVVPVVDCDDEALAHEYDDVADAILVDSTSEDGAGGTGETHDWERTRDLARELDSPVVLAGGLTPENVAEAVATVDPFAVDVASGVESTGGIKDPTAVETFVANAVRSPEVAR
ncbi:phosphoribosylanthranilate isomerase [Halogranum gelatinilyticum]|uniref:N-(5'-phosphoribosyl)anthranilate isomerase n=1 Tax=Halogranum gelatinilyticum TaxID=660521 RepID=A0A1G9UKY0_9EURY|nr:phosphoribosylanthranilate isomerase [Halogranum gelatinilyticum]SDM60537.1 phosphoribosylanthranilate isomerase [Halogranum gelatinilyticum]